MQDHRHNDRENAYASLLTGSMMFLLCLSAIGFFALNAIDHIIDILPLDRLCLTDKPWLEMLSFTGSAMLICFLGKGMHYSGRIISTQIRFLKSVG